MGEPTFWDDTEKAQKINQELNDVKISVDKYKALCKKFEDMQVLWEMAMEEEDDSLEAEVNSEMQAIRGALNELELEVLLSGPYDANNAQAVAKEKKEDAEPGTVIQVLQKGYTMKDRLLRAAMVKVSE